MAAIPLAPTVFPHQKRQASVGTTVQLFTFPAAHGGYLLTIYGSAALKVSFTSTLADGDAVPADYTDLATANVPGEWEIPATIHAGAVQVAVAAASGTATVTVELTRRATKP